MKIKGIELGGFVIKQKNILSAESVDQDGPKLVLTIDRVKAVDKNGKYIKWAGLHGVKNYILKYPIKITQ
jgi:hypothetical protein